MDELALLTDGSVNTQSKMDMGLTSLSERGLSLDALRGDNRCDRVQVLP